MSRILVRSLSISNCFAFLNHVLITLYSPLVRLYVEALFMLALVSWSIFGLIDIAFFGRNHIEDYLIWNAVSIFVPGAMRLGLRLLTSRYIYSNQLSGSSLKILKQIAWSTWMGGIWEIKFARFLSIWERFPTDSQLNNLYIFQRRCLAPYLDV